MDVFTVKQVFGGGTETMLLVTVSLRVSVSPALRIDLRSCDQPRERLPPGACVVAQKATSLRQKSLDVYDVQNAGQRVIHGLGGT